MKKISSVAYLRYCYDRLREIEGGILIFGHSVGENDIQIYDAIFSNTNIKDVIFCVHEPGAVNLKTVEKKLAKFWFTGTI